MAGEKRRGTSRRTFLRVFGVGGAVTAAGGTTLIGSAARAASGWLGDLFQPGYGGAWFGDDWWMSDWWFESALTSDFPNDMWLQEPFPDDPFGLDYERIDRLQQVATQKLDAVTDTVERVAETLTTDGEGDAVEHFAIRYRSDFDLVDPEDFEGMDAVIEAACRECGVAGVPA